MAAIQMHAAGINKCLATTLSLTITRTGTGTFRYARASRGGREEDVFVAASCMQACNLCRSKEQSQSFFL